MDAMTNVANHPEFALTRRELIRYVLSAPGDRAKEIQALLRLDAVEDMRAGLLKIANASEKEVKPLTLARNDARQSLLRALDIPTFNSEAIKNAANTRRVHLDLPPLEELVATTSLKDGLASGPTRKVVPQPVSKAQAVADAQHLREALSGFSQSTFTERCGEVRAELQALSQEPVLVSSVARERLLKSALVLVEDEVCPVCDTEWDMEELRRVIGDKLNHLQEVALKRKGIEQKIESVVPAVHAVKEALHAIERQACLLKPTVETSALATFRTTLTASLLALDAFLPVADAIAAIDTLLSIPADVYVQIECFEKTISALPESSKQEAAKAYLIVAQERLEAYQTASRRLKEAEARAALSRKVYDNYVEVSTSVLTSIYKEVQDEFTDLYKFINGEDEGGFNALLLPSIGKLSFDVDFYGRGYFPPGAYHSEGHQDGMGLCLYLALMKHLLGVGFTFVVLDDVLMSVDSGHRREVCKMLKTKFPDTQFILTTHDEVWRRHMRTANLITSKGFIQFRRWDVGQGPTEWLDRDVWEEIDSYLKSGDVRGASALLRNYLEYITAEICHRLRAPVEFRADAQFQLGDLLPKAIGQFNDILKRAKKAAQSWKRSEALQAIGAIEEQFKAAVQGVSGEQWQVNLAIHYNEWATLKGHEFKPVVDGFRQLVEVFRCKTCGEFLYVSPERGDYEAFRCDCGENNCNLVCK